MRVKLQILALAGFLVFVGLGAADNPLIGTWKLNLAKSKYDPSSKPRKSQMLMFESQAGGLIKVTAKGTDAEGNSSSIEYAVKDDGKDYPVTGNPNFDTVAYRRINSRTTERIFKKGGKVVNTGRRVLSKDGKTLTITTNNTRNGKPYSDVVVYDKQ